MEVNLEEVVGVINTKEMKKIIWIFLSCLQLVFSQENNETNYKKRVLESTEVDFLASYYNQDGDNASVTGGIGTEELYDFAPSIVVTTPLNEDDILTVDVGISTYTSASSSNLDPFDASGASGSGDDDSGITNPGAVTGSPWVASSGPSKHDTWVSVSSAYTHTSDDRNTINGFNASFATEYDYISFGFGGMLTKLYNEKNTEFGISAQVYIDQWLPQYPTELDSYLEAGKNLNNVFFAGLPIYNESGVEISKDGNPNTNWTPDFSLIRNKGRYTYAASFTFSQILSKNAQLSLNLDLVQQQGWLANPMQRVYFRDKANYFVGNKESIPNYTSKTNTDVFQLADDIEKLPSNRFKAPIAARLNYYVNEYLVIRTYYRYYFDNWGVNSNTAFIELPVKFADKFTLYPNFRYYNQSAATYFAPFNTHLSTQEFYTSDFDLSEFNALQYGMGLNYTDIFTNAKIWKLGIKSLDFRYHYYKRNTGLHANLFSFGCKFVMDQ